MAQNSAKTAKRRRGPGKQFTKGDPRINRGGRPKGLAALIREKTDDGEEMVKIALGILRGTSKIDRVSMFTGKPYKEGPAFKDRLEALKWLGDRGFGKALQAIELTGKDGRPIQTEQVRPDLSRLSDAQINELEAILAAASDAGGSPGGEGSPPAQ